MAAYLGDYAEDDTLHFLWNSFDADGGSITRATNGTISVYKDGGTTQSTAGITDTEDFDSLTGIHLVTIDLSSNSFYATGADYSVVLSAATIDGETVNAVLAHFSIENRYMVGTNSAYTGTPPTAASIRSEMDSNSTQLAAIVADTNELQTDDVPGLISALNDLSEADVNAQVDTALADIHLDHLLAADYDPASKPGVSTALLNELVENDGGVSRFTSNALEQGPSGGGGGSSNPFLLQNTTIATLSSQTSFTLTAGSADDDAYNRALVIVTDQSTSTQKAFGFASDYIGSSKTLTLRADPGIFTMSVGDTVDIVAVPTDDVAQAVWTHPSRGLNVNPGAAAGSSIQGTSVTTKRGDTASIPFVDLGDISTRVDLWFTVKSNPATDADTASIIQVEQDADLKYLNGASSGFPAGATGTITVDDASDGDITIDLSAALTAALTPADYEYDVQWRSSAGVVATLVSGTFKVTADVTRTTTE